MSERKSCELGLALIIEDCATLAGALTELLKLRAMEVRVASTVADAEASLRTWNPDLVLMDVSLPDGDALALVETIRRLTPAPAVIAMSGAASAEQAFALAASGVRGYLPKPITAAALAAAVDAALRLAPDLQPHLRASVGRRSLESIEAEVRSTLVEEALSKTNGSRRAAANLLEVSRQMLQHVLRR